MNGFDLPVGFAMALAQNETAMRAFESLSEKEKKEVIECTHAVRSRQEMHSLVESLALPKE